MATGRSGRRGGRRAWELYAETRRPGAPRLAARIGAAPRLLRTALRGEYPYLSRGKALAGALLLAAYLASPLDAVPDVIPVIGWVDDAGVLMWALRALVRESGRFVQWERAAP
ncbi:YkvA family protein [Streptomyces sp. NPDC092296]|uniref:YkvA family protein n=1 Tax=Streptomyces sp. NPDC092296 TaxID=3366012 RepID=UPI0037F9C2EE